MGQVDTSKRMLSATRPELVADQAVQEVMVARQAIYNNQMGVFGYELLFRSHQHDLLEIGEDNATAQVVVNAFLNMGIENLVGQRYAGINISEWYLYKAHTLPIVKERVILDFPSNLHVSKEAIETLKNLKNEGFVLAINDFKYRRELKPILSLVDIVKVDAHKANEAAIAKFVKQIKRYKQLSLLALRVENREEYGFFRDLGFDYCQGNLLGKPQVYATKSLSSNKLVIMNLLSVIYKQKYNVAEVERILSRDVSLSYKLLKLMNSPYFGFASKVESLQQAMVLLGRDQLRSWISMLALSNMDDCPSALIEVAVMRAKMCEVLAKMTKLSNVESFFTVGLFSALDVLMKQSIQSLLAKLPLSDEVKHAILYRQGVMGEALACVQAYEAMELTNARFQSLSQKYIAEANFQAFTWANGLMRRL